MIVHDRELLVQRVYYERYADLRKGEKSFPLSRWQKSGREIGVKQTHVTKKSFLEEVGFSSQN